MRTLAALFLFSISATLIGCHTCDVCDDCHHDVKYGAYQAAHGGADCPSCGPHAVVQPKRAIAQPAGQTAQSRHYEAR